MLANLGEMEVLFLSTLPARGATRAGPLSLLITKISIHAPREGSDRFVMPTVPSRFHFYPRSPRGERPFVPNSGIGPERFLSTLPARGATQRHRPAPV